MPNTCVNSFTTHLFSCPRLKKRIDFLRLRVSLVEFAFAEGLRLVRGRFTLPWIVTRHNSAHGLPVGIKTLNVLGVQMWRKFSLAAFRFGFSVNGDVILVGINEYSDRTRGATSHANAGTTVDAFHSYLFTEFLSPIESINPVPKRHRNCKHSVSGVIGAFESDIVVKDFC